LISISINLSGLSSRRMHIVPSSFFLTVTGFLGRGLLTCSGTVWFQSVPCSRWILSARMKMSVRSASKRGRRSSSRKTAGQAQFSDHPVLAKPVTALHSSLGPGVFAGITSRPVAYQALPKWLFGVVIPTGSSAPATCVGFRQTAPVPQSAAAVFPALPLPLCRSPSSMSMHWRADTLVCTPSAAKFSAANAGSNPRYRCRKKFPTLYIMRLSARFALIKREKRDFLQIIQNWNFFFAGAVSD
jgi:hypothetical protein